LEVALVLVEQQEMADRQDKAGVPIGPDQAGVPIGPDRAALPLEAKGAPPGLAVDREVPERPCPS